MWSRFINSDSWWLFESWRILRFHSPFLQGFSWLHHLEREAWDPEVTLFFRVSKIQKSIEICEFTFRLLDLGPGFIFKFGQRFLWPAWGLHHDILVHFQYAITMLGCWSFFDSCCTSCLSALKLTSSWASAFSCRCRSRDFEVWLRKDLEMPSSPRLFDKFVCTPKCFATCN